MTPYSVTSTTSKDQIPSTAKSSKSVQSLTANDFLKFLITQLQNQDPMNPTSSDQMLTQMSQIGQLQSANDLQSSLKNMVQQNQVASASALIGKQVQGTDQFKNKVSGIVTAVQVNSNGVALSLDSGATLGLDQVSSITNATGANATSPSASGVPTAA